MKNKFIFITCLIVWLVLGLLMGKFIGDNMFSNKNVLAELEILKDVLPIDQDNSITLTLEGDKREVNMSFSTYEYITKKRSRAKESVKNLESLFKRLEG